jgi:rhodanese-related sulfurtransferase
MKTVSPKQAANWNGRFIDVRNYDEYLAERLDCAECIPLDRVLTEAADWDREEAILCLCKSGARARKAAEQLEQVGFKNVSVVEGGLDAGKKEGLLVIRQKKHIPLFRQVFIGAGLFVLLGLVLATFVDPRWIILDWFVACSMVIAGITGYCPMAMLLDKMPWNKQSGSSGASCCTSKAAA